MTHQHRDILIALAGQPNVGKSTIFNMLTGSTQHVANFPGVTVEKRNGRYKTESGLVEVVDLPGIYSMTSYSQEERVARDFIILEQPEVLAAVADASNLERNLFLIFQLREMGCDMILCLNMMDVAEKRKIKIDIDKLSHELGVKVVPCVGAKGIGREEIIRAIDDVSSDVVHDHEPGGWRLDYGGELEGVLKVLEDRFKTHEHLMEDFSARWLAVKLMENDTEIKRILLHHTHDGQGPALAEWAENVRHEFLHKTKSSPAKIIASARYRKACEIVGRCVDRTRTSAYTLTDKIDSIVLHKFLAPVILIAVLFFFYQITMSLGTKIADWINPFYDMIGKSVSVFFHSNDLLRESPLKLMIVDGFLAGVFSILYYLPIFFILFILLAMLEDSGYMARIAFLMDRLLRRFGLHGQSVLPMLLGGAVVGGCAAPGILATRIIREEKSRLLTILIIPLLNCMAKIPVYVLIVGTFIPAAMGITLFKIKLGGITISPFIGYQGLILFGISAFGIFAALIFAGILGRFVVKGNEEPFVMELPNYHIPTFKGTLTRTYERISHFIKKIITVVGAMMVLLWALLNFPGIGNDKELDYDAKLYDMKKQLINEAGSSNRYSSLFEGVGLNRFIEFREEYMEKKDALAEEGIEDLSDKDKAKFMKKNSEFFLLANGGLNIDGTADDEAVTASLAFANFIASLEELKLRRNSEVINTSYASSIGKFLEPVSSLAGFNWKVNIAILSAFAAKENLVATLGSIYSVADVNSETIFGAMKNESGWNLANSFALLILVALFPPCIPTLLAIKSETGSIKWTIFTAIYPIILGLIFSILIFQIGRLM